MAKATPLSADLMAPPPPAVPLSPRPVASAVPSIAPVAAPKPAQAAAEERAEKNEPFQLRWPAADVKAMKRAALDADMSYSDYMLACFHAYNKA
jgi:hypothetical protein